MLFSAIPFVPLPFIPLVSLPLQLFGIFIFKLRRRGAPPPNSTVEDATKNLDRGRKWSADAATPATATAYPLAARMATRRRATRIMVVGGAVLHDVARSLSRRAMRIAANSSSW